MSGLVAVIRPASILRRAALLLAMVGAGGCDSGVQTTQDASRRVRDSYAWMADAELCPADLMHEGMRVNGLKAMSCDGSALPQCYRECRRGDVDSCYWLASTLEHAKADDPAVQALYQHACTLGEPSGCTNRAARLYLGNRRDAGVTACAARTFERTCALKDAWGCAMYGNALHEGVGVPQDDARALQALADACVNGDASSPACGAAQELKEVIRKTAPAASSGPGGP